MKSIVAVVLVAGVLGAAAVAAWLAMSGTDPIDESRPIVPVNKANRSAAAPTPAPDPEETVVVPVAPAEGPPASAPRMPDVGPEPKLPDELVPGAGQTFRTTWLADQTAGTDWKVVGVGIRRSILGWRAYALAVRRGVSVGEMNRLAGEAHEGLEIILHGARQLFATVAPFEPIPSLAAALANPVVTGNALAATLDAMNHPLTRAQMDALQPLLDAAVIADREIRGSLPEGVWMLERILKMTDARMALRADMDRILDDAQRAVLAPPEIRDRIKLDLLSPLSIWGESYGETGTDESLESMSDRFLMAMLCPANATPKEINAARPWFVGEIRDRLKRWAPVPRDALSRSGHIPGVYVLGCAREMVALGRAFESTQMLPAAKVAEMRKSTTRFMVVVSRDR